MKFEKLLSMLLILTFFIASMNAIDLSKYTNVKPKISIVPPQTNMHLNNDAKGWKLEKEIEYIPKGYGRSGTGCLYLKRTNSDFYSVPQKVLNLKKGETYEIGLWVKVLNIRSARRKIDRVSCVNVEHYGKGGFIESHIGSVKTNTDDWQYVSLKVRIPEESTKTLLIPYLQRQTTGEVYYDDAIVNSIEPESLEYMLYPANNTIRNDNGNIRLKIFSQSTAKQKQFNNYRCIIETESGGKKIQVNVPIKDGIVEADLGKLPVANTVMNIYVVDINNKKIIDEFKNTLNIIAADKKIPDNACTIDEHGRAIVNGKPFMPIGLYTSNYDRYMTDREQIDDIANSPFNTILSYSTRQFDLDSKKRVPWGSKLPPNYAKIKEVMDYCHKKKLKVIFSIKYTTKKDSYHFDNIEKPINHYKEHPALLAWYTVDETDNHFNEIVRRRNIFNKLDPFHPTYSVYCRWSYPESYGITTDVIGCDPYPISKKTDYDMKLVDSDAEGARKVGLPMWNVSQIFSWADFRKRSREEYNKMRAPTEKEMRSMVLLLTIYGSRGFIMFSYRDLFKETARATFKQRWNEAKRIAQMLKDMEPFIMSEKGPMSIDLKVSKGNIRAKKFINVKKQIQVVIAAVGPGAAEGIITLKTDRPLKSRFGNTTYIGNNRYKFAGKDVDSDVLEYQDSNI